MVSLTWWLFSISLTDLCATSSAALAVTLALLFLSALGSGFRDATRSLGWLGWGVLVTIYGGAVFLLFFPLLRKQWQVKQTENAKERLLRIQNTVSNMGDAQLEDILWLLGDRENWPGVMWHYIEDVSAYGGM